MPGLVAVIALVVTGLDVLLQRALEQTELQQAFGQRPHGSQMAGFVGHSGPGLRKRRSLRRTDEVMQRALLLREAAVHRKGARDVRGIAAVFGAGVDQHQVAVAEYRGYASD